VTAENIEVKNCDIHITLHQEESMCDSLVIGGSSQVKEVLCACSGLG